MPAAQASSPPIATLAPFAILLGAVAVLPLLRTTARWWDGNLHKLYISLACGGAALGLLAAAADDGARWTAVANATAHAGADFVPFIVLLAALYIISGGILITGDSKGSPAVNTGFMALGAVLANVLGTTGASMLLIRPLLRSNRNRSNRTHTVIFFIFLVSNIGGLLLPLGDPPLFLGYLRGVPFTWTLSLWPMWSVAMGAVLVAYYAVDSSLWKREARERDARELDASLRKPLARDPPGNEPLGRSSRGPGARGRDARHPAAGESNAEPVDGSSATLRISGARNFVWLAGVVWATACLVPGTALWAGGWTVSAGTREIVTAVCALASLATTSRAIRAQNHFTFAPILEVAALFCGLFLAMQPALAILIARGDELGIHGPAGLFWSTGVLSSILDNAPTYLVFANIGTALTTAGAAGATSAAAGVPLAGAMIAPNLLAAVSCGAVFMGANTYIGNGPNLMVAAIARAEGVPMPSFFGYMLWSGAILLPIFGLVTLLFFV